MKIYAPVKDANGVYASVRFVNGVGETDNPRLIEWFRQHGYKVPLEDEPNDQIVGVNEKVEEVDEPEVMGYGDKQLDEEVEPDFDNMTPFQLRDWMLEHGYNVRNIRSRDKLLEILRG